MYGEEVWVGEVEDDEEGEDENEEEEQEGDDEEEEEDSKEEKGEVEMEKGLSWRKDDSGVSRGWLNGDVECFLLYPAITHVSTLYLWCMEMQRSRAGRVSIRMMEMDWRPVWGVIGLD